MIRLYVFKPDSDAFRNCVQGRIPKVGDYILTFDLDNHQDEKPLLYQQTNFGKTCVGINYNNAFFSELYPKLYDDLVETQESFFALMFTPEEFKKFSAQFQPVSPCLEIPKNESPTSIVSRHTPVINNSTPHSNSFFLHENTAESFNFNYAFGSDVDDSSQHSNSSLELSLKSETDSLQSFIEKRFSPDNPGIQSFLDYRRKSKSRSPETHVTTDFQIPMPQRQ